MWDVIIAPYVEVGINHSHAKLRLFQFIQSIVIVNYLPAPLLRAVSKQQAINQL